MQVRYFYHIHCHIRTNIMITTLFVGQDVDRGAKREISREGRGAPILRGLGEFFQIWPLIRAFSELFGGGARPFGMPGGGRAHPRLPLFLRLCVLVI